jgi:hypothetical protein
VHRELTLRVSLSKVLRWIAYPVEPFDFEDVQGELPPPLPQGIGDIMGKPPCPSEEATRRLANRVKYLFHKPGTKPGQLAAMLSSNSAWCPI